MTRQFLRWTLLGIAGFGLVLLVRLPANWAQSLLPPSIHCDSLSGTLWRGQCRGVMLSDGGPSGAGLHFDLLVWQLQPWVLLRGRVSGNVELVRSGGQAAGHVEVARDGLVKVRALSARLPVDRNLLGMLPAGWSAEVGSDALGFSAQRQTLLSLNGSASLQNLRDARGNTLGSFEVQFGPEPQAPPVSGQLRDMGGPLAVTGTLRIEARGAWQMDGRITPRPGAPAELVRQLQVLGLPDPAGAYPFSIAAEGN